MKPTRRHELEAMVGVALFVFVILGLVSYSLYEHGYLGVVVATVGGVALSGGLIHALLSWAERKDQVNRGRSRQEEERRVQPHWEREILPGYKEPSVQPMPQERREEEERPKDPPQRYTIAHRLGEISDGEFERLMAYYFRHQGYTVDTTPGSVGRGADLMIAATDRRISVLLKRREDPVSERAVQEALGGRAFYGAYETWLVTNSTFTREARYEAKRKGVRLIDGDELVGWLEKIPVSIEDEPQ